MQNNQYNNGQTATNPQTGEKVIFRNGVWQPFSQENQFQEGQTATNPNTGQKIVFQGGSWQELQPQQQDGVVKRFAQGVKTGATELLPLGLQQNLASVGGAIAGSNLGKKAIGYAFGNQDTGNVIGEQLSSIAQQQAQDIGSQAQDIRSNLTTAGKIGAGIGESIPAIALTPTRLGLVGSGIVGGAITGATTPTEQGTLGARGKEIATQGALGGVTGSIFKVGSSAIGQLTDTLKSAYKGVRGQKISQLDNIALNAKQKASQLYEQMRNVDGDLTKDTTQRIVSNLDSTFKTSGKINSKLHGDTLSVLKQLTSEAKNQNLTIEGFDQYRQLLSNVVQKNTDIAGHVNADGLKARMLMETLDNSINKIGANDITSKTPEAINLLKEARDEWARYRKFDTINQLFRKAGGEPDKIIADPNKIRYVFRNFLNKNKQLKGFTQEEQQAIKNVASSNGVENTLKALGKFGIDFGTSSTSGNTALPVASVATGLLSGHGQAGAGVAVVGTIARKLHTLAVNGRINDVIGVLENTTKNRGAQETQNIIQAMPNGAMKEVLLRRFVRPAVVSTPAITNE